MFTLALLWALIGIPLSFIATGASIYVFLTIALLPITLITWSRLRVKAIANGQFNYLLRQAGIDRIKGISHLESGTGIVMNHEKRMILLADGKRARAYNFDEIRSWETKEFRWSNRTEHIFASYRSRMEVSGCIDMDSLIEIESGFFVTPQDWRDGEWRISMRNEADRSKWTEIFNQAFSGSFQGGQNASA